MRRALGLDSRVPANRPPAPHPSAARPLESHAPARHRHRFVHDGEVPVVVVHPRSDQPLSPRPDRSTAQIGEERAARERAERDLSAARARIRDLETQLVHVSLARDEAVSALRQTQDRLAAALVPAPAPQPAAPTGAEGEPVAQKVTRRRGRPPKVRTDRPVPADAAPRGKAQQPVKWWVKGWRDAMAD